MRILYLSFSNTDRSVNKVYIKGLEQNGVEVLSHWSNREGVKKIFDIAKFYRLNHKNVDFLIVGYDSPGLVVWLAMISRKKIIYNALCSVYERLVVSRGLASKFSLKAFYYWLLDFLACHTASLTMLESNQQIDYFSKLFFVPKKKCFLARTGVDEEYFYFEPNIKKFDEFTVIFRGRLLPEAGAEYVVMAAKKLENQGVKFIMHSFGQELQKIQDLIAQLKPVNLKLETKILPDEQLRELMQKSHLSLGQLSAHDRLTRTIPHKAYESLTLKLPYLTARNKGIMELLKENETCLAFKPADADDLAAKILWAKNYPQELAIIAENGRRLYLEHLTSKLLAEKILERIAK